MAINLQAPQGHLRESDLIRMQQSFCPGLTNLNLNELLGLRDSHQVPA